MGGAINAFMPKSELLYHSQQFHRASLERHRSENCNAVTKISPRRVGDRILAPLLFKRNSAIGSKTALGDTFATSPPAQCRTIAVAVTQR